MKLVKLLLIKFLRSNKIYLYLCIMDVIISFLKRAIKLMLLLLVFIWLLGIFIILISAFVKF